MKRQFPPTLRSDDGNSRSIAQLPRIYAPFVIKKESAVHARKIATSFWLVPTSCVSVPRRCSTGYISGFHSRRTMIKHINATYYAVQWTRPNNNERYFLWLLDIPIEYSNTFLSSLSVSPSSLLSSRILLACSIETRINIQTFVDTVLWIYYTRYRKYIETLWES